MSTALGYVLLLSVTVLLVAGLLISANGMMEDQREVSAEGELRVVGDRVAADVMTADRLVQGPGDADVVVTSEIPAAVSNTDYVITVEEGDDGVTLVLETADSRTVVETGVANTTPVVDDGSPIRSGTIEISYEDDRLVVRDG